MSELGAGDPAALAVLLRDDARVGAGGVDERDDGEPVAVGELHHAHRLAVALGVGHAEVPVRALADVAPLLVPDEDDRCARRSGARPRDDRGVVRERAVAVQLDEVVEDPLDVVERVRPLLVARELDGAPDLVLARLRRDPVDLALEPRHLAGDADPAQKREVAELGEPLA